MITRTIVTMSARAVDWTVRLAPAAALFSLLFVFDGALRWLGLLGFLPLILALHADTMRCGPRGCRIDGRRAPGNWPAP